MKKVGQLLRQTLVDDIKEGISNNGSAFLLSYSNISGIKISDLRKTLKKAGASMYVTKNSIAKVALKDLDFGGLTSSVSAQTALIWSNSDSSEISKILVNFAKDIETVSVQGGLLEGRILTKADVTRLSDLPSREVLLSMLLATIQSPLTRLAGALNAKTRELLSILKQLSEKKGGN